MESAAADIPGELGEGDGKDYGAHLLCSQQLGGRDKQISSVMPAQSRLAKATVKPYLKKGGAH